MQPRSTLSEPIDRNIPEFARLNRMCLIATYFKFISSFVFFFFFPSRAVISLVSVIEFLSMSSSVPCMFMNMREAVCSLSLDFPTTSVEKSISNARRNKQEYFSLCI